mgnify:CR=1 FL=1
MANKNFILNDEVRCFSYGYQWRFDPLVTVQKNPNSTVVQELVHDPYDWATFMIPMRQLQEEDKDDLQKLILNVGGNQDSFLFRDEFGLGNFVERNTIGNKAGAGSETFQALRTYTIGSDSRTYEVWNIEEVLGVSVWVGGSLLTEGPDYTVDYIDSGEIEILSTDIGDVEFEGYMLRRVRFTGTPDAILQAFDLVNMNLAVKEESPFSVV